jgi:superfamily II DNA/RNA helicase
MPKSLVEFTKSGCFCAPDPHVVRLDSEASVSEELRIAFITCRSLDKDAALLHILSHIEQDRKDAKEATRTGRTLIFCATRHHVEYVANFIRASQGGGPNAAALLYGTLDPAARNANLASFRNGSCPILITTDVAARGIDVPMIDHVIHYHFPPNAKLFVHRSGRAARAGRIGFCWGLVDPEELPYMVELHLFLGRRLATAWKANEFKDDDDDEAVDDNTKKESENENHTSPNKKEKGEWLTYTLSEMTPDMVHYGGIPESIMTYEIESVRRIMDSEMTGSDDAETMRALSRVCLNAMKQYRRSRPEASREAVRRAKAILEGERMETGQRVLTSNVVGGGGGGGSIPPHPLLRGMELQRYHEAKKRKRLEGINTSADATTTTATTDDRPALDDLDNMLKREEFLRAMSNFRPKETVFEAFATGGGKKKDSSVVSHVDKGRTTSTKAQSDSIALKAMRSMRRQMRMARDKGSTLVVAGSETALARNNEALAEPGDEMREEGAEEEDEDEQPQPNNVAESLQIQPQIDRRRISKAERKRLKNKPDTPTASVSDVYHVNSSSSSNSNKRAKTMRGADFRDPAHFMENDITSNTEEAQRSRHVEASMQPSASALKGAIGAALRIEEAMLDLVGDERDDLVKSQRLTRWDKAKRKYVTTTVGSELSGDSRSKKLRTESGKLVKSDKMKLGELYEKWQKKTNRSVGRNGVFDDPTNDDDVDTKPARGRRNSGGVAGSGKKGASKSKKDMKGDKLKSAAEIKMDRAQKQNSKVKNMKKGDRQRLEQSQRQNQGKSGGGEPSKGNQGKKGASGRWGSSGGKGKGPKGQGRK